MVLSENVNLPINNNPISTPLNVVLIQASGHSGGTLLSLMLNTSPDIFAAGHLDRYRNLLQPNFWEETLNHRDQTTKAIWADVSKLIEARQIEPTSESFAVRVEALATVHAFLRSRTNTKIICDYSTNAVWQNHYDDARFNVFHVHLVRDGRAVANSYEKKYGRHVRRAWGWAKYNLRLRRRLNSKNYYRIRYEDLVENPELALSDVMAALADHFAMDSLRLIPSADQVVDLDDPIYEHQILVANRLVRLPRGERGHIKKDRAYLANFSFARWWLYTLVALPTLLTFGYRLAKDK